MTPLELASRLLETKLANRNTLLLADEVVRLSGVEAGLRAEVASMSEETDRLRAEVVSMRAVVEAAGRWTDTSSVHDEVLMDAVRQYRAAKP